MPDDKTMKTVKPEPASVPVPSGENNRAARRFLAVVLALLLLAGVFILVTNGVYYALSKPVLTDYEQVQNLLDEPAEDSSPAARMGLLDRYKTVRTALPDLDAQLADLDGQFWTFAILIRSDYSTLTEHLMDVAQRGEAVIDAYLASRAILADEIEAFLVQVSKPAAPEDTLAESLDWYADQIEQADQLETEYQNLITLVDIELAGPVESPQALGLDLVTASVSAYRQAVLDLNSLLVRSEQLEQQVDDLYQLVPIAEKLGATETLCDDLMAEIRTISQQAAVLSEDLPEQLHDVSTIWGDGQIARHDFVLAVKTWWQYQVLVEQSLESARTDRATAKRYIADSLAEENVETAYVWTRTAERYKLSMNTALDFANIYIARSNDQLELIELNRLIYRTALDYEPDVLLIDPFEAIDPDEFWLTED